MASYDLIVIGSGTAAMVAHRMADAGRRVAVIDHRPFGGTCALRGCDPKKMLIAGAEALDDIRRLRGRGVVADAQIDWRALLAFKRSFTDPVPEMQEKSYAAKGIDTFHGTARFIAPNGVEIDNHGPIEARHILIATGARPAPLGFRGEEHLVDNEGFLELEALPRRIVLVGGGFIAAEFAHIAARAGAQVIIIEGDDRILGPFDPDLVGWLMESFASAGIDVRTSHTVEAVEKTGAAFAVRVRGKDGTQPAIEADLVVHAAGRIPDLEPLELAAADIATDDHGRLRLNEYLQSVSNPAIYAAGDAAARGPPLTPVASHDARVVVGNLLEGNRHRPDYRAVPSVAFTIPPIARVGMLEEDARAMGLRFRLKCRRASDWYTAKSVAQPVYGFKVMVEEESERVIGAHLVGPHADEVINLFALAMRNNLTAEALRTTLFAYPTGASDIGDML